MYCYTNWKSLLVIQECPSLKVYIVTDLVLESIPNLGMRVH